MLRITNQGKSGEPGRLLIEGRVDGDEVAELSRVISAALSRRDPVVLDMSGVTFVSREGMELLQRFRAHVELEGCSSFVAALLNGDVK